MHTSFMRENREILSPPTADGAMGRIGKAKGRNPMMHGDGKSDGPIVPTKPLNKARQLAAEVVEGRGSAKGNTDEQNAHRTQSRARARSALGRVRQAASRDRKAKFTALFHHITVERLREAFLQLKRRAAPGVDGVVWEQYVTNLDTNIEDLHSRLHRGAYRARPSRRV
jgi:RNA-directed DNA polymerase